MLAIFNEFRKALDEIMLKCMHDRVAIYGYDTYTGRFLKWYAEYYHGISVDYLISEDMSTGNGYDREIFRPSIFDFGYKDIKNAVVWLAQPMTELAKERIVEGGYQPNSTLYDFYAAVYGDDVFSDDKSRDVFFRRKVGKRDIQFLEWLEWKYGCNFITPVSKDDFEKVDDHGSRYSCSTQKEIFPILDHCHICPSEQNNIMDFGCGKGGAMISFLDYGFGKVGGVEYEPKLFKVATQNINLLNVQRDVELICDDARNVKENLDIYNWFYFFFPFDRSIFETVIENIKQSYLRKKRKIYIIYYTAMEYDFIESTGVFRLINQFTVDSRQRVVGVFESKE